MEVRLTKEVEKFIKELQKTTTAKALPTINLLETFGHLVGMPHSKKLQDNLYELRIRDEQEIIIFYTFSNNNAILFYGFIKKSQKAPKNEISKAVFRLNNLDL